MSDNNLYWLYHSQHDASSARDWVRSQFRALVLARDESHARSLWHKSNWAYKGDMVDKIVQIEPTPGRIIAHLQPVEGLPEDRFLEEISVADYIDAKCDFQFFCGLRIKRWPFQATKFKIGTKNMPFWEETMWFRRLFGVDQRQCGILIYLDTHYSRTIYV